MIIGTTFFRMGGVAAYSPAFPRGGEAATFSVEVFDLNDSPTFVVTIQHKNDDDIAWADLDSFSSITTTGVFTKSVTAIKEQVRLKYTFSTSDALDGVRFIVPAPAWRPY